MDSSLQTKCLVLGTFAAVLLFSSKQLAAEHSLDRVEPMPLAESSDDDLICDYDCLKTGEDGSASSSASSRWLQYRDPESLLSRQTDQTARLTFRASNNIATPQGEFQKQTQEEKREQNRRRKLLVRYDTNGDGRLSRYELPRHLSEELETESEERNPSPPSPQPAAATSEKTFQNLLRYQMPATRQPPIRRNPFAQAATFGPRVGSPRRRTAGSADSHCHVSRCSMLTIYWAR